MSEDTINLNHSKLGTKNYWDEFYVLEKKNFESNPEDTGENWFDDNDAEEKMVDFLISHANGDISESEEEEEDVTRVKIDDRVCDLGTGNGHLLFSLREEGWQGNLVGVDYSEVSIEFANKIKVQNEIKDDDSLKFEQCDILNFKDSFILKNFEKFDIVTDKGTLDAIGLSEDKYEYEDEDEDKDKKKGVEIYPFTVSKLIKKGGILLITSCNFTYEELIRIITNNSEFKVWKSIKYPSFQFGGIKGSSISSIAFIKE